MANNTTTFSNKCYILSELWQDFRDEEQFQDFIRYNDLGLPLAYAVASDLIGIDISENDTDIPAVEIIEETWDLLVAGLGLKDRGYESLEELLAEAQANNN